MTIEQFAYWLNGFVELNQGKAPTTEQWKSIVEHLGTVFNKVTPIVEKSPVKDVAKESEQKATEPNKQKQSDMTDWDRIIDEMRKAIPVQPFPYIPSPGYPWDQTGPNISPVRPNPVPFYPGAGDWINPWPQVICQAQGVDSQTRSFC